MMDIAAFHYIANEQARKANPDKTQVRSMDRQATEQVKRFHKSFPEYEPTPLHSLKALSRKLNVGAIWIKDESYRFGLNAFKVLGGSYAVGKYLAKRLNMDISEITFEKLQMPEIKERLGELTFVTATDGNHGRGIAWAANRLGQKSVVFMPKGSSAARLYNIRKEGAEASITELNYDDTVRLANRYAAEHNGVLIQDSAWEGYEEIPTWIMQGYSTLINETMEQIKADGQNAPTHVFLQAGVGSFAASVLGYYVAEFGDDRPATIIVEPSEAACIYKSATENDGKPHAVTGDLPTIMAGLACGEPSTVAWGILRDYADMYISCPDAVSAKAMRMLGNPLPGDPQIISGESGAVGLGVLSLIQEEQALREVGERLQLNEKSRVLIISTEGDTDPEGYRDIVWNGKYPSF
ncbi:diaminopropionate ammonia-lyase [Paenibacillus sophorae]|uniref:Diaminopropionate ammonia-lyase n=1 Tax=Paenibacillus sophorae TaxID=1333845 RepID=A0A1H8LJ57_9BACL|nr:diaminopropionate ammonia-lyase [Paenibacillus sophorae]QWU17269.1 diaminopropionate ammonia-lyase [Paenibacillus sophorae]SEO05155.1 diaminopropionate ammonia-lyase [Paenibacillus sophorae]